MADVQNSQIRIGDTERESALNALSEHMTAGRLDIDEYGDRTAKVAAAKTRGELLEIFGDLPAPHPTFGVASAPAMEPVPEPQFTPMPGRMGMSFAQRMAASAVPMAGLVALVLFFAVAHTWIVFLIPAAVVLFGGAIWGDGWKHQQRMMREQQREQLRQIRRRGRGW